MRGCFPDPLWKKASGTKEAVQIVDLAWLRDGAGVWDRKQTSLECVHEYYLCLSWCLTTNCPIQPEIGKTSVFFSMKSSVQPTLTKLLFISCKNHRTGLVCWQLEMLNMCVPVLP